MTTRKRTDAHRGAKKLKLNKETIRDLDSKGKAGQVKGGGTLLSCQAGQVCFTQGCATALFTNCLVSCNAVCGVGPMRG
jgi:hypothetical protein